MSTALSRDGDPQTPSNYTEGIEQQSPRCDAESLSRFGPGAKIAGLPPDIRRDAEASSHTERQTSSSHAGSDTLVLEIVLPPPNVAEPSMFEQSSAGGEIQVGPRAHPAAELYYSLHLQCNECGQVFSGSHHRTNLNRHIKSVHGASRFECDAEGCGEIFNRLDNLKAHMRALHGQEEIETFSSSIPPEQNLPFGVDKPTSLKNGTTTYSTPSPGEPPQSVLENSSSMAVLALWRSQNHNRQPTEVEIDVFRDLTKLTRDEILSWLQTNSGTASEAADPPTPNSVPNDQVRKREPRNSCLAKTGSGTPWNKPRDPEKPYCCIRRCGSTFAKKGDWIRHVQISDPRYQWVCREESCHTRFTRRDKLNDHLRRLHGIPPESKDLDSFREDVAGGFPRRCGFCGLSCTSWTDWTDHIGLHFEDKIQGGPWDMNQWKESWPQDDESRGNLAEETVIGESRHNATRLEVRENTNPSRSLTEGWVNVTSGDKETPMDSMDSVTLPTLTFTSKFSDEEISRRRVIETGPRSSKKCSRCRRMRLKCLPAERTWPGQKCERCEKHRTPCGPNLTPKQARESEYSSYTSASKLGLSHKNRNEAAQPPGVHEDKMDIVSSGSSSEGTTPVNGRGIMGVKIFSRKNPESPDKLLLKLGYLLMFHNSLRNTRDTSPPLVDAKQGRTYALLNGLKMTTAELEWTIGRLARLAEEAAWMGDNLLADRIFLRLLQSIQEPGGLSARLRASALSKMASFYQKLEDEPQLQRILQMLSSVVTSEHIGTTRDPNEMLARSLLSTSRSMSSAFADQYLAGIGIQSPALHQSVTVENYRAFKIILDTIVKDKREKTGPSASDASSVENSFNPNEDIDTWDTLGRTPLFLACLLGHEDICNDLILAGAHVNEHHSDGHTILEIASRKGLLRTVERLIEYGADINAEPLREASTALQAAAEAGHLDIIKLLTKHGADWSQRRADGKTALQLAQENGHHAAVYEYHAGYANRFIHERFDEGLPGLEFALPLSEFEQPELDRSFTRSLRLPGFDLNANPLQEGLLPNMEPEKDARKRLHMEMEG